MLESLHMVFYLSHTLLLTSPHLAEAPHLWSSLEFLIIPTSLLTLRAKSTIMSNRPGQKPITQLNVLANRLLFLTSGPHATSTHGTSVKATPIAPKTLAA